MTDNNIDEILKKPCAEDVPPHRLVNELGEQALAILDGAVDSGISILNADMEYQYISASLYEQLNIKESDLKVGDHLSVCHDLMIKNGLLTPEIIKKNELSATIQKNRHGGAKSSRILEFADGRTMKHSRTKFDNGYTVSISHDISTLVEKDQLLEGAMFLGKSGYWIIDLKTKKIILSKTLRTYLPPDVIREIRANGINVMHIPEDRHALPAAIKQALQGEDKFQVETRIANPKGDMVYTKTFGDIIRDHNGQPTKIRAFVKDVTNDIAQEEALNRAKDAAIQASKAKSEFLANMSHEIRTPMNGILGMAELLGNTELNSKQRDFVRVVNNSAQALLTIINDILDFSKVEAGALTLDPTPFDLKETLGDVAALMRRLALKRNIELIVNYSPRLPRYFVGDVGRLRQVITNLISNAIKFTNEGYVAVDVNVKNVRQDLSILQVSVTDTGIGIEKDKLRDIFQKFTQADGSTTRLYGGTGLGLTISKCIVELMNGRIQVKSTPGEGSVFSFAVPLPTDKDAKPVFYETSQMKGRTALIVDDVAVNRHLLCEHLETWGITAITASSGHEALKILNDPSQGPEIDFALLDYLMPDMDGIELAEKISQSDEISGIPLAMLTSCDPPLSRKALSEKGIIDCVTKPIREKRLFDLLGRLITTSDTLKDLQGKPRVFEDSAASQDPVPAKAAVKTRILVAEDFDLNQDVVRHMLNDSDFEPIFANNGQLAFEAFEAAPDEYALVLMDLSMPVKNGYEATDLIRAFEKSQGRTPVPIIALTGHALKYDREKCLKRGMNDYLSKPVKHEHLVERLNYWMKKQAAIKTAA